MHREPQVAHMRCCLAVSQAMLETILKFSGSCIKQKDLHMDLLQPTGCRQKCLFWC